MPLLISKEGPTQCTHCHVWQPWVSEQCGDNTPQLYNGNTIFMGCHIFFPSCVKNKTGESYCVKL